MHMSRPVVAACVLLLEEEVLAVASVGFSWGLEEVSDIH